MDSKREVNMFLSKMPQMSSGDEFPVQAAEEDIGHRTDEHGVISDVHTDTFRVTGEYAYELDEQGRVTEARAVLRSRDDDMRIDRGKEKLPDQREDDHKGHLFAHVFGGAGKDAPHNLSPQNGNLNQSAWKRMENEWGRELKPSPIKSEDRIVGEAGNVIEARITPVYEGDSQRPQEFQVTWKVASADPVQPAERAFTATFPNESGADYSPRAIDPRNIDKWYKTGDASSQVSQDARQHLADSAAQVAAKKRGDLASTETSRDKEPEL